MQRIKNQLVAFHAINDSSHYIPLDFTGNPHHFIPTTYTTSLILKDELNNNTKEGDLSKL